MSAGKLWTGLANMFGVKPKAANTKSFSIAPAHEPDHIVDGRRSKHADHPKLSMRRGAQVGINRKHRPFRMAAIANSIQQALDVRKAFRDKQLIKREIRVELRKAAAGVGAVLNPAWEKLGPEADMTLVAHPPVFCKSKRHAQSLWPKDKGRG